MRQLSPRFGTLLVATLLGCSAASDPEAIGVQDSAPAVDLRKDAPVAIAATLAGVVLGASVVAYWLGRTNRRRAEQSGRPESTVARLPTLEAPPNWRAPNPSPSSTSLAGNEVAELVTSPESSPLTLREPALTVEFIAKLGSGTMGEVWLANQTRLGRAVAVKLIADINASSIDVARFKREARAMSDLRSPHSVQVYSFGTLPDGAWYYAMELLDGIDLQELVRKHGPLPPARVGQIAGQICHALEDAHRRGLVHRDLKPANVMLCRHGCDRDFVKVVDFGLVLSPAHDGTLGNVTSEHSVVGTAAYLAPESALNGSSRVDLRADLYALGALMFWLLTGRLVFQRDSIATMVNAHLTAAPPFPSEVASGIPPELDRIVVRCLAKNPEQRFSDAGELRRLLLQVSYPETWTEDDARGWWRHNAPEAAFTSTLRDRGVRLQLPAVE